MRYGKLSSSQETIYGNCKEKIAEAKEKLVYERLMQQPIKASAENGNLISQCNQFLATYPESSYSPQVRGMLVRLYCSCGSFDSALNIVEQYPQSVAFSETFTPDLPWWKKYIKQREKQYNRK